MEWAGAGRVYRIRMCTNARWAAEAKAVTLMVQFHLATMNLLLHVNVQTFF